MSAAFGSELGIYEHPRLGTFRGRSGEITVPAGVADMVTGVLGLADHPAAEPHFRVMETGRLAQTQAYTPQEVAALYAFPGDVNGNGADRRDHRAGRRLHARRPDDLLERDGRQPAPAVTAVGVDGAGNTPDGPDGADGEVMLDIEVVGAVAPGAAIAVYFAPNTDRGLPGRDHHGGPRRRSASRRSSRSAGGRPRMRRAAGPSRTCNAYDQAFQDAAALGVTVTVAAGDDGSNDNVRRRPGARGLPGRQPVGAGVRRHEARPRRATTIVAEVTWNEATGGATGGGVSRFFALPAYQAGAGVPNQVNTNQPGRGVPDVAGDADPQTGYQVRVDGQEMVIGGTSAVAPL